MTKSIVDPKQDLTADGRLKVTLDHAMSKLIIKVTVNNGMEDAAISKLGDMAVNGTIAVVFVICQCRNRYSFHGKML